MIIVKEEQEILRAQFVDPILSGQGHQPAQARATFNLNNGLLGGAKYFQTHMRKNMNAGRPQVVSSNIGEYFTANYLILLGVKVVSPEFKIARLRLFQEF